MKSTLSCLMAILILGCTASKRSQYNTREKIDFQLVPAVDTIEDPNAGIMPIGSVILGGLITLIPTAIDLGVDQIGIALEKESQKYTASYSGKIIGDDFYLGANEKGTGTVGTLKDPGEPTAVLRFGGIDIQRTAADKRGDSLAKVMDLQFAFRKDKSGRLLYLEPVYLKIDRTKAKLRKGDTTVDLLVTLQWNASWMDKAQKFQQKPIAELVYSFRNVTLEVPYGHGDQKNKVLELLDARPDYFPPIPVSLSDNGEAVGYGNYSLEIVVTEMDDYGQRIAQRAAGFRDKEADLAKALKNLLE